MIEISEESKASLVAGLNQSNIELQSWNSLSFLYEPAGKPAKTGVKLNGQQPRRGEIRFEHFNGYWKE